MYENLYRNQYQQNTIVFMWYVPLVCDVYVKNSNTSIKFGRANA